MVLFHRYRYLAPLLRVRLTVAKCSWQRSNPPGVHPFFVTLA